jgi:hypothetical protein
MAAPDKKAKLKKATCWAARGACAPEEAQGAEWNPARLKREPRGRNFGALEIIVSSQLPNSTHQNFSNAQTNSNANSENTEGVGET